MAAIRTFLDRDSENPEEQTVSHPPLQASVSDDDLGHSLMVSENAMFLPLFPNNLFGYRVLRSEPRHLLGPNKIKDLILSQRCVLDANVVLFVLIGLLKSIPEHVMKGLFNHCLHTNIPFKKLDFKSMGEYNEKGLSFYELEVLGKSEQGAVCTADSFCWTLFTKSSGYLYCFLSALMQYSRNELKKSFCLSLIDVKSLKTQFFKSPILNNHFLAIYECLMWNYVRHGYKTFSDKKLLDGITLVNVWNISWNKAVMHFLSLLAGHLDRSFPVLMFGLNEHGEKLNDPVTFELGIQQQSNAEFLLQFAHLGKGREGGREKVCTVAAVVDPGDDEERREKRERANKVIHSEAERLGVNHLTQDKVWFVDDENVSTLKGRIEGYIIEHKETFAKVPLSWILLRSAYFKTGQMYIKKSELKKVAKELGIVGDNFEKFLLTFSGQGSIVYVPGIDALEENVILNPFDFCYRLNELFEPRFNGHFKNGLVFGSYFHRLFGNDAEFFMEVLTSSNMAVELNAEKILYEFDKQLTTIPTSDHQCFFIPTSRETGKNENGKNDFSLYINISSEMGYNKFPVHMVKEIIAIPSVFLIPSSVFNMTTFCFDKGQTVTRFSLCIHQGSICELRCDIRDCDARLKNGLASAVSKALSSSERIDQPSNTHPNCLTTQCVRPNGSYHSIFGAECSQVCDACKCVREAWRDILQ